jgi:spermidine/putrescine transport system substrate-binding protein
MKVKLKTKSKNTMKFKLRIIRARAVSSVVSVLLGVCSCNQHHQSVGLKNLSSSSDQQSVVNLAIWSHYIPPELLEDFTNKTGIRVQVSNYSSNEELLAKLQAGASGYDVAVPSDYMVFAMSHLGLLVELAHSQLPNMASLDSRFLKRNFDPANRYSVPYDWGTTGIAVNTKLYPSSLKSWKELFEKEDLKGGFSLLDDAREVLGAALKSLGYSLNSKNLAELKQAQSLVLKARRRVKAYTSEPLTPLVNGEFAVAHIFMSDALQARKQIQKTPNGSLEYLIPAEGGTLWIDNLVIPKGALHIQEAYQLINFLLQGSSNAKTVMSVFVAPANRDALQLLPLELRKDPALFPSESALAHCEMIEDLGEFLPVWDRLWTEIKAE